MSEIDRVQSTTTFNELSLLDGTMTGVGLQVGAEANQHIDISIRNMSVGTLFTKTSSDDSVADVVSKFYNYDSADNADFDKQEGVKNFASLNKATKIALNRVSKQRSDLGAVQNRLEHTINNLDNVVENTTSAESAIRDTDMATEMVRYSNNNILQQAGQAMLAQANQANQGVLALLS